MWKCGKIKSSTKSAVRVTVYFWCGMRAIRESPLRMGFGLRHVVAGVPDGPCGTWSEAGEHLIRLCGPPSPQGEGSTSSASLRSAPSPQGEGSTSSGPAGHLPLKGKAAPHPALRATFPSRGRLRREQAPALRASRNNALGATPEAPAFILSE